MPVTLDEVPALIVIDLQKGILAIPTAYPAGVIVERCGRLARAFRERGLPVVLVNVDGRAPGRTESTLPAGPRPADWTEIVPELDLRDKIPVPLALRKPGRTRQLIEEAEAHLSLPAAGCWSQAEPTG